MLDELAWEELPIRLTRRMVEKFRTGTSITPHTDSHGEEEFSC
jgi:hypothetical protein